MSRCRSYLAVEALEFQGGVQRKQAVRIVALRNVLGIDLALFKVALVHRWVLAKKNARRNEPEGV